VSAQPPVPFADRRAAGRDLAGRIGRWAEEPDLLVLALPRGGLPVAAEVARAHRAPLDVFVVRKLGVPGHEELALGAVASGGVRAINRSVVDAFGITREAVEAITALAMREIAARETAYREGAPALSPAGRTVLLVDDGLATGATMRAAIAAVRSTGPRHVVVAVPVAPPDVCAGLLSVADDVICAATPDPFGAVGLWYHDFAPVSAAVVREILERGRQV
jgi:predicted phosphoribosyltransferase